MTWDPPPGPPGWNTPQPQGPAPFGPPPQQYAPAPYQQYPEADRSSTVLVLGIMGIVVSIFGCAMCGPLSLASLGLSIPAIAMGKKDLRAIDEGA